MDDFCQSTIDHRNPANIAEFTYMSSKNHKIKSDDFWMINMFDFSMLCGIMLSFFRSVSLIDYFKHYSIFQSFGDLSDSGLYRP